MWNLGCILIAPFLIVTTTALPAATVIPSEEDFACVSSKQAWEESSSDAVFGTSSTSVVRSGTYVVESTDTNVPTTTLCDARPRALESYRYTTVTEVVTHERPWTITQYGTYTEPIPTCTVAETVCTYFWEQWESSLTDYLSRSSPYPKGAHCETIEPPSTWTPRPVPECSEAPEKCVIVAHGPNRLYYWPVTTVDGDFCLQNGSTIAPEPTIPGSPNTAVVDGHTFTSPTNYVSIGMALAQLSTNSKSRWSCGTGIQTSILLPVTGTLSSIGADKSTSSLNFANFNQPVPGEAWDASWRCQDRRCRPLTDGEPYVIEGEGDFKPVVPFASEIAKLEEDWSSVGCTGTADWRSWSMTPVPLQTPPPRPF